MGEAPSARVMLRPLATPLPLAFLALFVATTNLAATELGWVTSGPGRAAALAAVLLTAPLQALAAVVGFLSRDPVAGTGTGILAGAWGVTGVATLLIPDGSFDPGLGVFLLTAAAALLVPAVAGFSKLLAATVLGLAAVRFAVTGVAELARSPGAETVAGVAGLVLGAVALYAALAFELEGVLGRAVLPIGRTGNAAAALSGGPEEQVAGVEHEAGVRRRL